MTTDDLALVPDTCTLPSSDLGPRLAEFDDLFASSVRHVEVVTPTYIRLDLTGADGLAATVRDLTARETRCCSFFRFTVSSRAAEQGEAVRLDIEVPARYADVLDALRRRATTAARHE